jgi:ABC-type antimicrobial peptide transport system permease subunit
MSAIRHAFQENLRLALDTLRAHKLRSFLTVLGVVIGVGVIIIVTSLLAGFDQSVMESISGYGADTAFVYRWDQGPRIGRMSKEERMRKPLTAEDGFAIEEYCPAVKSVAISLFPQRPARIRYKDEEVTGGDYRGTFPSFVEVYANAAMKYGRFFTEAENTHSQKVVVVGENIAEGLFGPRDPVGREIQVDGVTFTIIGVFEKPKGGFGESDEDRRVAIPYYTMRKIYPFAEEHGFRVQAQQNQLDLAVDQVRDLLRRRRNVPYNARDSFSITTSQQAIEQFHAIVGAIALVTVVLSSIGLLVGGVGVMNIMLVSVTERTREIGVRKAIGARRGDILWQFLLEAMTLTGSGGIIGIVLFGGLALSVLPRVTGMNTAVPVWAAVAGFVVSVSIGLIFGVWPAVKAARLDPVEALRYE